MLFLLFVVVFWLIVYCLVFDSAAGSMPPLWDGSSDDGVGSDSTAGSMPPLVDSSDDGDGFGSGATSEGMPPLVDSSSDEELPQVDRRLHGTHESDDADDDDDVASPVMLGRVIDTILAHGESVLHLGPPCRTYSHAHIRSRRSRAPMRSCRSRAPTCNSIKGLDM